jgi:lipopolysaccharide export system protein LptC
VNIKQLGLFAVLLLIVVGSGWFLDKQGGSRQPASVSSSGPDSFVEDVDLTVMDELGYPKYRVKAKHMSHFPNEDILRLSQPDINITRTGGAVWQIVAERGETTTAGDQLWLLGAVDIRRPASVQNSAIHVVTSDLLIKPEDELAETDKAAAISGDRYRINAIGMKVYFRTGSLELLSRVRGTIDGSSDGNG